MQPHLHLHSQYHYNFDYEYDCGAASPPLSARTDAFSICEVCHAPTPAPVPATTTALTMGTREAPLTRMLIREDVFGLLGALGVGVVGNGCGCRSGNVSPDLDGLNLTDSVGFFDFFACSSLLNACSCIYLDL
jgi:hypothetical protein